MKVVTEGRDICQGASETYLAVFIKGEEKLKFYTPFSSVRWQVIEKAGSDPTGQYWVAISYINTGTKHPTYGCGETKYASVYGRPAMNQYEKIQGAIRGIVLNKKRYEGSPSYKLKVENSQGTIIEYSITDRVYGNRSLKSKSKCDPNFISAALPGSVVIEDIIPITGGYEYEFRVFDERGLVFSRVFEEIPTIDDYCVFPEKKCPAGTCQCDCGSSHVCCYDSVTGEVVTSFLK